ncbi:MAG TPA: hypothetical protein PLY35_09480 [Thermotogota bacterium]|nr:hypothetical protein [Thermotogota bacterium]
MTKHELRNLIKEEITKMIKKSKSLKEAAPVADPTVFVFKNGKKYKVPTNPKQLMMDYFDACATLHDEMNSHTAEDKKYASWLKQFVIKAKGRAAADDIDTLANNYEYYAEYAGPEEAAEIEKRAKATISKLGLNKNDFHFNI